MCADSLARCFATSVQNSSTKKPCVDNCHYLVTLRLGGKCTRPPRVLGRKQCTATASYECKQSSESTLVGGTSHALSVGDLVDLISRKVRWRSDESTPETVCRSVQRPFLHSSSVCPTHRHYRHRGTHVAHLAVVRAGDAAQEQSHTCTDRVWTYTSTGTVLPSKYLTLLRAMSCTVM